MNSPNILCVLIASVCLVLASCSDITDHSPVLSTEHRSTASRDELPTVAPGSNLVSGEWLYTINTPTNPCGVAVGSMWVVVNQQEHSWSNNHSKEYTSWTANGYGYTPGNNAWTVANPPPSNGSNYRISFSQINDWGNGTIGMMPVKSTTTYTVTLLPNGPTVSWTVTTDWSRGTTTISNIRCR